MIRDITLIGLGAVGAVMASGLGACPGVRFRVAADPERIKKYGDQGLFFNGARCEYDFFTPSSDQDYKADLVIVATKFSGLGEALELIEPVVGPHTMILPLLNGISAHDIVAARYGQNRTLYGIYIGHTASRYGNQITHDGRCKIIFGRATNNPIDPQVKAIGDVLTKANLAFTIDNDMIRATWRKFIANIGLNQTTAALRCKYGHIKENPQARELMTLLMQEAAAIASVEGIAQADQILQDSLSMLDKLNSQDGSSMYQDVMQGRITELDMFAGEICRLGKKHGIPTPFNHAVELMIGGMATE